MARVALDSVRKVYDNGHVAVHGASLEVADGEFVVLVGPSGCGKSTTLRMIAGLETVTSGTIRIGDRVVNDLPATDRDVAMVFQSYALYPHMTVFGNLAFGLTLRRRPRAEVRERVGRAAALLGLEAVLDRRPAALSGGQRQRVALGRALVREPAAFLLDEPLSNLDATLRAQTRAEISRLHRDLGATTIYVTHDQVEAMTLGDRVVVLDGGRIQQVAPPLELYDRPANTFVAGFVGSPAMNFVRGAVVGGRFRSDDGSFEVGGVVGTGPVTLGVRPEDLYTSAAAPAARRLSGPVGGRVEVVERMGNEVVAHVRLSPAVRVAARLAPQALSDDVELRIDLDKVHRFDPETGAALATA